MGVVPPQNRVLLEKPVLARLFIKTVLQSRLYGFSQKFRKSSRGYLLAQAIKKVRVALFWKLLIPPFQRKKKSAKNIAYFNFYSPPKFHDFQNFRFLTIFPIVKVIKILKIEKLFFFDPVPNRAPSGYIRYQTQKWKVLIPSFQRKKNLAQTIDFWNFQSVPKLDDFQDFQDIRKSPENRKMDQLWGAVEFSWGDIFFRFFLLKRGD